MLSMGILSNVPGFLNQFLQFFVVVAGIIPGYFASKIFGRYLTANPRTGVLVDVVIGGVAGALGLLMLRPITDSLTRSASSDTAIMGEVALLSMAYALAVLWISRLLVRPAANPR